MTGPVLLVLPSLGRGGAERVFVDLAGGLADHGDDVHLAWASGGAELAVGLAPGVTTHELGRHRTAAAVPGLRRLVGRLRPRAVVSALFHGNVLAAAATRGRRRRPVLVFTEHGQLGALPSTAPRRLLRWSPRIVPFAYRSADAVVAVSAGVARDLVDVGRLPRSLIHHIPNPVDFDRIDRLMGEAGPAPSPIPRRCAAPLVVAAGRLVPVKGFDVLIRAMAAVRDPTRLLVLGEGPERARLEALAGDLGVADRIDLPGAVDNPYPQMAEADVFVSSSRTEALPTVLIEALHLGRPVVAADCSAGVREVLDDGALGDLVPPDDPPALARAIGDALDGGGAGPPPPGAMAPYACAVVVARYEALLDRLAAERR